MFRRRYTRNDANSKQLDERAQVHGVSVWRADRPYDRIWGIAGIDRLVEYKNPDTDYGRRGLSDSQRTFARKWHGAPPLVIATVEDVDREVARLRELGRRLQEIVRSLENKVGGASS